MQHIINIFMKLNCPVFVLISTFAVTFYAFG